MAAQPTAFGKGTHLLLYDGVCGLCSRLVHFVLRRDPRHVFDFAALQSAVGQSMVERSGGHPDELSTFYVIANYKTDASRPRTRSDGALFIAGALGWPWKAALLMWVVPKAIRDAAYNLVARHRYHVFGRDDRCPVPSPEFRSRFLD